MQLRDTLGSLSLSQMFSSCCCLRLYLLPEDLQPQLDGAQLSYIHNDCLRLGGEEVDAVTCHHPNQDSGQASQLCHLQGQTNTSNSISPDNPESPMWKGEQPRSDLL